MKFHYFKEVHTCSFLPDFLAFPDKETLLKQTNKRLQLTQPKECQSRNAFPYRSDSCRTTSYFLCSKSAVSNSRILGSFKQAPGCRRRPVSTVSHLLTVSCTGEANGHIHRPSAAHTPHPAACLPLLSAFGPFSPGQIQVHSIFSRARQVLKVMDSDWSDKKKTQAIQRVPVPQLVNLIKKVREQSC